jgi:hypothetical protein
VTHASLSALRRVAIVAACLGWLAGPAAHAQRADAPPASLPPTINMSEFQGVSCLVGGTAGGLAAWTYAEVFIAGAIAGSSLPIVLPVVATAFVAGCGVGSVMSPGLLWIYRRLQ